MATKTLTLPTGITVINKSSGVTSTFSDPVEVTFNEPDAPVPTPATAPTTPEKADPKQTPEKSEPKK